MNYDTSQDFIEDNKTITLKTALRLIKRHNIEVSGFYKECGEKENYNTEEIIRWMGY